MIIKQHFLSKEDDYTKYNYFEIEDGLESILAEDYYTYKCNDFKREEEINSLYNKNFVNKYDRESQKEIFDLYIDNEQFKEKAMFIYSVIDVEKYAKFVEQNQEIDNANDLTIKYSILDSTGVKVQMYHVSIVDISFVF